MTEDDLKMMIRLTAALDGMVRFAESVGLVDRGDTDYPAWRARKRAADFVLNMAHDVLGEHVGSHHGE